jgi:toxin ParE1/3/4
MVYKILLLPEVRIEVSDAVIFYKQFSDELASDLLTKFYQGLEALVDDPLLLQADKHGFRKINLKRFPYKIIFKITTESIVVIAFMHHKRRPGYWRNR